MHKQYFHSEFKYLPYATVEVLQRQLILIDMPLNFIISTYFKHGLMVLKKQFMVRFQYKDTIVVL